jgi:mRNA interferase MazF
MRFKHGDVVLLLFPHSNLLSPKRRPALIVQSDKVDTGFPQKIVAMVTSNLHRIGPTRVLIEAYSEIGKAMGIKIDSVVVCDNLATVLHTQIDEVIGHCPDVSAIETALRTVLDL